MSVFLLFVTAFAGSFVFSQEVIDPNTIDIVRDQWGVPHIFAKTDAAVAYGLAWAHAEDDFETLQKAFLASKAMLGLYLGSEGATVDYFVHLLGLRQLTDSLYASDLSAPVKAMLQGYCDGINAYARAHPKEVLIKRLFPVLPQDIVTYSVLQQAIGCGVERELKKILTGLASFSTWVSPVIGSAEGSNAFAFNPNKTSDGCTYLAINTHHPLEGQVAWYEAHLVSEEGMNVLGSMFPGIPVVLLGVNENIAWAHTVNHPDVLDVYQLEMHPDNPLMYRVDSAWYVLEERPVKLKVKVPGFNLQIRKKVYRSIYGPTVITENGVFSIRTAGIMDIRGIEQWYRMNKAGHFTEFMDALKMQAVPAYNTVYADRFDTIYYLSNAKLPLRKPGFNWRGILPGNTAATLWNEFHPLEDLPQVLNPSCGYVYNTNHSPFKATAPEDSPWEGDYDPTMGYETHDNNRSLRVRELLEQYPTIGFEEFKRIKYDLQLPEKLIYPVNIDTLFLLHEREYPEVADLIITLKQWDRRGTIDSWGAAIFAVFFYHIADRYQRDRSFTVMTKEDCAEAMRYVKRYLIRHFGTTRITLGEYQRLERGYRSIPLAGLPDVLAAMYSVPTENGRVKGSIGECYIALVRFTDDGPQIETVQCYGASNREDSPHFDDQMELFQNQLTKTMTLNREQIYLEAKTIYHPQGSARPPEMPQTLTRGRQ